MLTIDGHGLLEGGKEGGAGLLLHSLHADAPLQMLHQPLQERAEVLCPPNVPWHLRTSRHTTLEAQEAWVQPAKEQATKHIPNERDQACSSAWIIETAYQIPRASRKGTCTRMCHCWGHVMHCFAESGAHRFSQDILWQSRVGQPVFSSWSGIHLWQRPPLLH